MHHEIHSAIKVLAKRLPNYSRIIEYNAHVRLTLQGTWPSESQQEQADGILSAMGQSGNAHQLAASIGAQEAVEAAQAGPALPSSTHAERRTGNGRLSRLQPEKGKHPGLAQRQIMSIPAADIGMPPAPGSEEEKRLALLDRLKQVGVCCSQAAGLQVKPTMQQATSLHYAGARATLA